MTVPLHYETHGPAGAPVVLFGCSLGTSAAMWSGQVTGLADRYRMICFDHRGHGRSPVPPGPYDIADLGRDVLALLDRLGLARVHYVGLSLGGMVGMWLAAHAPERIDRLALLCTAAHLPPAAGWQGRAATVRAGGLAAVAETVVGRWFTAGFDPGPGPRAMLLATPIEGYAACCEAIAAMDLRPDLPRITAPTLVIAGAQDAATPPELAARLVAGIPDARLEVLPDAAHLAAVQQPAAVNALLDAHLSGAAREPVAGSVAQERFSAGMAVRRAVLGDAHVDRAVAGTTAFTADFQDLITRYAWGEVWTRDGLDRRTRSCVTLAVLATLRAEEELAMHVRAARRNGLTAEEIREVLLQVAIYAGVPAANTAFAVAARTLFDEAANPGPQEAGQPRPEEAEPR